MAISLPDARQLSDEVLQSLRLRALRGCELGYSEIEVAELLGLSRETVSRWWTAYVDHGLEALPGDRTGRPVGSGRTLNDGQAARLRTILNEKSPEEVGIASPLWTRRAVAELIRKEYGIDMPVRTVGEYLERWGYTAKVPRRHAKDQDPEEVRHWLEVTYPAIEARAAREDAEIHWCDETGAAAHQQPRRGYAREGRPARIEVPDPHIRMNLISTISNEGSVHFMTYKETMTAALFITFLERMLSETTRKIFLIVDRLRAHEAKKVEARAAEHRDRIELFFLPRYAPERNADEYLNNDMKGSINATGLPGSQGGVAPEDPGVHDQVAAPAGACSSVLPTPLRQVCCWYLRCDHLTCQRNKRTSFRNRLAPPILLQQLKGKPGQDSPCVTKVSFYPAENGQLEVFPKAVHVSKANLPEPTALVFNEGKNVGRTVWSFEKVLAYLLKGHFFALLLPPLVEMCCHGVIKHLLAPWRATGDVFGIQENAACRQ